MIEWALNLAFAAVTVAMTLCAWRLLVGPSITDRLLALDSLYINVVVLTVLLGLQWKSHLLFEAALVIAMLGFVSTVALARYLCRGDVIE
jgi:multicomponent K+:H+ antiporter subunit F